MEPFDDIVAKHKKDFAEKRNIEARKAADIAAKKQRVAVLLPVVLREAQLVSRALKQNPKIVPYQAMDSNQLWGISKVTKPKWHSGGMSGHNSPPSQRAYRRAERQFAELTRGKTFPIYDLEQSYAWSTPNGDDGTSYVTENYSISEDGKIYEIASRGLIEHQGIYGVRALSLERDLDGDHERRLQTIREGLGFVMAKYGL